MFPHNKIEHKLYKLFQNYNESYYWQGFILADGYINHKIKRFKIHLAKKDSNHIQQFCKFIEFNNPNKQFVCIQDKIQIDNMIKIWKLKPKKSYNPSYLNKRLKLENRILIYAGFIDGDGAIQYQTKRKDCKLTIKLHKNWYKFLRKLELDIFKFCGIKDKKLTKINNQGYASLVISDNTVLRKLKRFLLKKKLPLLSRKWNKINLNDGSRYETVKRRDIFVQNELKKGKSLYKIAKENNFNYSTLYMRFYRKEGGFYV